MYRELEFSEVKSIVKCLMGLSWNENLIGLTLIRSRKKIASVGQSCEPVKYGRQPRLPP